MDKNCNFLQKKNKTPQLIMPLFNFEWEIFEKSKKNSGKELVRKAKKRKRVRKANKSHMSNDVRDDKLRNSEGYK